MSCLKTHAGTGSFGFSDNAHRFVFVVCVCFVHGVGCVPFGQPLKRSLRSQGCSPKMTSNMSVFADMSQEMVLVQRLAELQERLKHAEMLNHQRWEDVLSLQRDLGNRNGTGEGTLLDLQLPAIYNFLPHLANGPDAIRPALKVSKGRTGGKRLGRG